MATPAGRVSRRELEPIPRVAWADLREYVRRFWRPGEHVAIVAPTGGGKTFLATRGLLPVAPNTRDVAILDPTDDPGLDAFGRAVRRLRRLREVEGDEPDWRRLEGASIGDDERERFGEALGRVYADGKWTVYVDELRILSDSAYLGLPKTLERLWLFGRKRGLTLVAATQAPRYVPSAFYEQSKWHYIFGVKDRRAIDRLGEIQGDVDRIRAHVPLLEPHSFLVSDPAGRLAISRVEV